MHGNTTHTGLPIPLSQTATVVPTVTTIELVIAVGLRADQKREP
jgi:hypothetical protein